MSGKWIAPGQSRLWRDESLELGSGENLRDAERLKAEVRSQKSEVRGQRSEVRGQSRVSQKRREGRQESEEKPKD
jgi:hypothetical protein